MLVEMMEQNPDPPEDADLIELLENEEGLSIVEPEGDPEIAEPWLGFHEPDYSLVPDRKIPLDKAKYPDYNKAMLRFAEIADKNNLRLHKHYETARHWVFECFFGVDRDE